MFLTLNLCSCNFSSDRGEKKKKKEKKKAYIKAKLYKPVPVSRLKRDLGTQVLLRKIEDVCFTFRLVDSFGIFPLPLSFARDYRDVFQFFNCFYFIQE
jgi:hypothetical protein